MYKVVFMEQIGLPTGPVWFQKIVTLPFAPFPGLSVDGCPFESADWDSKLQQFTVRFHLVITEYDSLPQAIADQASYGWTPCPAAERIPSTAIKTRR